MAMDDRKQRIMMAIVSLYSVGGEPVGSNLLSRNCGMAVSSATLRNEMAALTRLGLLEQPHTSAGRVPTAKGYRFYVDNVLKSPGRLSAEERTKMDEAFRTLDYDPEKMAQGAGKMLSDMLQSAVLTTTPRADDIHIAHYEVIQVGRFTAAVLAVTAAGGVRTRVAKVEYELDEDDIRRLSKALNTYLCFVSQQDVDPARIRTMVDSLGEKGPRSWPVFSAALTLMEEAGTPQIYFEGQQHLLHWPELEGELRPLMELMSDQERITTLLRPRGNACTILFGEEFADTPIPGLCIISRQYVAGGGLAGIIAVVGPTRIHYREVIPRLDYFSELLGQGMSGNLAG